MKKTFITLVATFLSLSATAATDPDKPARVHEIVLADGSESNQ